MTRLSPDGLLYGRDDELRVIRQLITEARQGRSGVLVIHGQAGIGKTALIRDAASAADGFTALRVAGIESEAGLGYAALQRLLTPLREIWPALPVPQRRALEVIFGVADGPAPDPFLVGLATLTVLDDAARSQPVLCLVDDGQWLDSESLSVLTFVARRLAAESIAMLFAFRESVTGGAPLPEGLPHLSLGPLSAKAAGELLHSVVPGPLDDGVAQRVLRECGGSPLGIIELSGVLSPEQLLAADRLPDVLPISDRLQDYYLRRMRSLPRPAQTFLLLAAANVTVDPGVVQRAAALLGLDEESAAQVEASGLARLTPDVTFRHPLIRSAVLAGASASELRRVHRALADAIESDQLAEAQVWHLAAATFGPDDTVAEALDAQAEVAGRRGSRAGEAALRARAAGLTRDPEQRARRQVAAAHAYLAVGSTQRAGQLIDNVPTLTRSDVVLSEAARIQALLASFASPGPVPRMLLDAADLARAEAPGLAARIDAEALQAVLVSCQLTEGLTPGQAARRVLESGDERSHLGEVVDLFRTGFATRLDGDYVSAAGLLDRALDLCTRADDKLLGELEQWPVFVNNLAVELWELHRAGIVLDAMERFARRRGALGSLRITLGARGHLEMWRGRFAASEAAHDEATAISVALGADRGGWEVLKVELFAWRGDEATARSMAGSMTGEMALAFGSGVAVNIARTALVTLALGQGNYAEAAQVAALLAADDIPPQGNKCLSDLVEATTRTGAVDSAKAALDRLQTRAAASPTEWSLGLLARCRALVESGSAAQAGYAESIERLSGIGHDTEAARSHLLYGEWLRRQDRRTEAREHLRIAYEMFSRMGAEAFRKRSRIELAATGERARKRVTETVDQLTPQELQIASLAARGQTNREIAAQLFISASTVDYHLRKVFRKLGVTTRRALRPAMATN